MNFTVPLKVSVKSPKALSRMPGTSPNFWLLYRAEKFPKKPPTLPKTEVSALQSGMPRPGSIGQKQGRSIEQDFDRTNSTGPSGFLQLLFLSDRDRLARSTRSIDGDSIGRITPPVTECQNRSDELSSPDRLDRSTGNSSDRDSVLLRNLSQIPTPRPQQLCHRS